MDGLLRKYKQLIDTYSREYILDETRRFPKHYRFEDKVKSEYMSIHGYVNDKNSNEAFFDSNQSSVIEDTLEEIRELIALEDYETAAYVIVSLQIVMGLEVKLTTIVYSMVQNKCKLEDYVEKDKYLGRFDYMIEGKKK